MSAKIYDEVNIKQEKKGSECVARVWKREKGSEGACQEAIGAPACTEGRNRGSLQPSHDTREAVSSLQGEAVATMEATSHASQREGHGVAQIPGQPLSRQHSMPNDIYLTIVLTIVRDSCSE